jgi:hypothetical protein
VSVREAEWGSGRGGGMIRDLPFPLVIYHFHSFAVRGGFSRADLFNVKWEMVEMENGKSPASQSPITPTLLLHSYPPIHGGDRVGLNDVRC